MHAIVMNCYHCMMNFSIHKTCSQVLSCSVFFYLQRYRKRYFCICYFKMHITVTGVIRIIIYQQDIIINIIMSKQKRCFSFICMVFDIFFNSQGRKSHSEITFTVSNPQYEESTLYQISLIFYEISLALPLNSLGLSYFIARIQKI